MARVTLNAAFDTLSGNIGRMIFYTRLGTQCARSHVIPRNPDSACQRKNRNAFRDAVKLWQALSEEKKNIYRKKARRLKMTGYNLFISEHMKGEQVASFYLNSAKIKPEAISTPDPLRSPSVSPAVRLICTEHTTGIQQAVCDFG